MILEKELSKKLHELIAPTIEVTGVNIKDARDEAPDVFYGDRLGMHIQSMTV